MWDLTGADLLRQASRWFICRPVKKLALQRQLVRTPTFSVIVGWLAMHVTSNVQGSSTKAGGASAGLEPILLHGAHEPQRSVRNLPHVAAKLQAIGKAVNVQAWVHRPAGAGLNPASLHLR